MANPFQRARDSTWKRASGFSGLSTEIQESFGKRLLGLAVGFAGAWVCVYLIFGVFFPATTGIRPPFDLVRDTLLSLALAAVVVVLVKTGVVRGKRFVPFAMAFQLAGMLLMTYDTWDWVPRTTTVVEGLNNLGVDLRSPEVKPLRLLQPHGVPGGAIWLLMFPLFVPLPPRAAAISSFVSASVPPAILLIALRSQDVSPDVQRLATGQLINLVSLYVVASVAVFASFLLFRLNQRLSEAQELGSYRLHDRIGQGGMGEVWRAQHKLLARPAAVKLIRPDLVAGTDADVGTLMKRFEREAQATAALSSPHTIEVWDFGTSDDGTFYYVMEFLEGMDLRSLVEKHGPVPAERCVHILAQACHSLRDAHAHGLVHRDIKPANLFVCRRGLDHDFVKVLDFGLVKSAATPTEDATQLTHAGGVGGTPAFIAPEMALGGGEIDGRADLYALGCVGYWLLTGALVFEAETPMKMIVQHAREIPVPPSARTELEVPDELDRLIMRLLSKEPDDRPGSARDVLDELDRLAPALRAWTQDRAERWWATHHPRMGPTAGEAETQPVS